MAAPKLAGGLDGKLHQVAKEKAPGELEKSAWALAKVIADVDEENASASSIAGKMVSRLGEPVVRRAMLHAMKIMGQQFVMGHRASPTSAAIMSGNGMPVTSV